MHVVNISRAYGVEAAGFFSLHALEPVFLFDCCFCWGIVLCVFLGVGVGEAPPWNGQYKKII